MYVTVAGCSRRGPAHHVVGLLDEALEDFRVRVLPQLGEARRRGGRCHRHRHRRGQASAVSPTDLRDAAATRGRASCGAPVGRRGAPTIFSEGGTAPAIGCHLLASRPRLQLSDVMPLLPVAVWPMSSPCHWCVAATSAGPAHKPGWCWCCPHIDPGRLMLHARCNTAVLSDGKACAGARLRRDACVGRTESDGV